ncbi:hypothetical protein T02_9355 [Trichinella nativa]|uniref:Uncharacterized protein n=1 Tax=Trichinella nativa TaxID=6335 RepID=A0A0V1L098_9BILA|nr:hypothetical protein T02_9355 [Trichinella nativa]
MVKLQWTINICVVSQLVDFHGNCDINPNYHAIYNQFIRLGSRGETNWAREAFASAASFNASTNTHSLIFAINNDGAHAEAYFDYANVFVMYLKGALLYVVRGWKHTALCLEN